jgi:hypothetical protein
MGPGRRHRPLLTRLVGIVGVVALLLAACTQEPSVPPTEEGELGAGGSGPLDACDDLEPTYDPPPEEQPSVDGWEPDDEVDDGAAEHEPLDETDVERDGPDAAPPAGDSADPMSDARAWAQREAPEHFAGVWLDAEAGAPVIAFTEEVASYAEEVRDRFGDEWWVVEVAYSEAELMALQEEIVAAEMGGEGVSELTAGTVTTVGLRSPVNRVSVGVLEPDEDRLTELAERYGVDRICVEVEPIAGEGDAQPARWEPAADADLSAESTSIDVLVNEVGCASGEPADGRIATPEISYSDDAVVVTMRVVPPPGPQTCPSNPDTEYTLELDEPLGERELLDGAHDPPTEPDLERTPPDVLDAPGEADAGSPGPVDG